MNLDTQLAQLENSQLVRQLHEEELAYIFKHALTQDTAYQSLLLKTRREIHRRVAEAHEKLYADRLDEFAALLAQHYAEASDDAKTLEYATRAGDVAARLYANAEAIMHYSRALETVSHTPITSEQLSHLYHARGRVLELSGRYEEALTNYAAMEAQGQARGERTLELAALVARATIHSTPTAKFDPPQAQALSERALALARALDDRQAEAKILWNLMLLDFFTGRLAEAVEHGEQSIAIAREFDLREQLAYTLNDIQRAYGMHSEYERSRAASAEARAIWRQLDNKPMLADNLAGSAFQYYMEGDYDQALALSDEAYKMSQAVGNLWGQSYSLMNNGLIYFDRGQIDRAIATMEECLRLGDEAGFLIAGVSQRASLGFVYGWLGDRARGFEFARRAAALGELVANSRSIVPAVLAQLHTFNGEFEQAEAELQSSYEFLRAANYSYAGGLTLLADAELGLAKHDYARAFRVGEELLAAPPQTGARPFASDARLIRGRAKWALGETDEAFAILMEARATAEALGSRRSLWEILATLSDVETQRGNLAAAQALRAAAREVIQYMVEHIPTAELRDSFLNLPNVRSVISEQ